MNLSESDLDYVICLSSSSSLATTPEKDNWIEHADTELPPYVRKLARGIRKSGKTLSQAIAIAISRIKVWAAGGGDVNADTRAKATKAVAQWEAAKAKNKARKVAKLSARSGLLEPVLRPVEIIALSGVSFSLDSVREAFDKKMREYRKSRNYTSSYDDGYYYAYVKEVWNTHLIVQGESSVDDLYRLPYSVGASGDITFGDITFGEPVAVVVEYVEAAKDLEDSMLEPLMS